ncbi:class I SAM-dependent methyltransferase [Nocardioides sp. JQ2195]|uniref:class I SAM-dependent methyltransferase n=1 Tax=Nocardioides sp. JQ2195 TaxID=2592334 RepID=UPI00143EADD1|nr:class I SAM-dependent methyltransferase [Nocardioides sp. JQ2195]QIX28172.1 class I SAM-dependent methyltransferase [Nocardioides sp. JQ2195]
MSRGAVPSPNIWHNPATYELENRAVDPDGVIETTMRSIADWSGRTFLDLGCGTGFHLPRWARAGEVIGVEPHPDLVAIARRRVRRLTNVQVLQGAAQRIPLPDASVDVVQARWAYFFGPGCEPGLAELDRVVRRGGTAFVIDNDPTRSTFGGWFRRGYPEVDPVAVERFWSHRGWQRHRLTMRWEFTDRSDFEAVVRIEFDAETAEHVLSTYADHRVDYAVNLWSRTF